MTLLLGFGLPPVLQLARVPPLRVIRRDVGGLKAASATVLLAGVGGFAALLMAVSSDAKLGAIAVGGFALAVGVFALLAWVAVRLLKAAVPDAGRAALADAGHAPDRGAAGLCRAAGQRPGGGPAGPGAAGAAAHRSHQQLAPGHAADAPNRFVINLQPEQSQAFQARLAAAGVQRYDWYPMIRGRLLAINGKHHHRRHLRRWPRQPPGGARVQPQPHRRAPGPQPDRGRRLGGRRSRRPVGGRRPGAATWA
jgi:putative ABC transport system permease protein